MPAIVEFPQVVRDAVEQFRDLFVCDPQRRHLAEYLTGLMVAANKTVTGINGEFVDITDPSCLNRFLTEVEWDEKALNERRLELLQRDSTETLRATLSWVVTQVQDYGKDCHHVFAKLRLA